MIHKIYSYDELVYDLMKINTFKKFIKFKSIGKTVNKKDIFLLKIGNGEKNILAIGGHHSLETMMSCFLADYLFHSDKNDFDGVTFYAIPLLNVDGADFFNKRITIDKFVSYRDCWQANYNGVDLNHNYDAGFYLAKKSVEDEGITQPHYTKYGGEFPFSEPETQAIKQLCECIPFDVTLSFHTQGREIFSSYNNITPKNTDTYLQAFEKVSGYKGITQNGTASHGGFKDWFIQEYQKPAFTIEAGIGKNPIYQSQYSNIYTECSGILNETIKICKNI